MDNKISSFQPGQTLLERPGQGFNEPISLNTEKKQVESERETRIQQKPVQMQVYKQNGVTSNAGPRMTGQHIDLTI